MAVCHYSELRIMSINKNMPERYILNLSIVVTQLTEQNWGGRRGSFTISTAKEQFPCCFLQ